MGLRPQEKTERYARVWDAIADTPQEAENLRVRSDLMGTITGLITENKQTTTGPTRPSAGLHSRLYQ